MKKYEIEVIGYPSHNYDDDVFVYDKDPYVLGVTDLIHLASEVKSPGSSVYDAALLVSYDEDYWKEILTKWQNESGLEYPPIYRVKFTVEAEVLSDEELKEYWDKRKNNFKTRLDNFEEV